MHSTESSAPGDWWKSTALFLAGVTVTGVTSWFAFWSQVPTKEEVMEMIHTQTPYVMDGTAIRQGLNMNTKTLQDIDSRLREVEKKQIQLNSDFQNRIDALTTILNSRMDK